MPKPEELPVTDWYPAKAYPVRNGWYQAKGELLKSMKNWRFAGIVWRYWNGKHWEWCPAGGRGAKRVAAALALDDRWRGLAVDPNAKERK